MNNGDRVILAACGTFGYLSMCISAGWGPVDAAKKKLLSAACDNGSPGSGNTEVLIKSFRVLRCFAAQISVLL